MSLRKWHELAKRKSELGKKINFVHDAITKQNIGKETSQASFEKQFKPMTSKLDDVIGAAKPQRKIPRRRGEAPDYTVAAADDSPDLDLGDLFEPQEKPPAKVTTLKEILGSLPGYEEGYDDFLDYRVETEEE